ncbi:hypothetical protein GQS52_10470 [Streptomyces sp. SCUT-3]|nr:hypothetical protein GQS52_10470 [Streptomyces sp. SCUT-3]
MTAGRARPGEAHTGGTGSGETGSGGTGSGGGPAGPVLARVLRGSPTPAELAALTVALATLAGAGGEEARPPERRESGTVRALRSHCAPRSWAAPGGNRPAAAVR